MSRSILDAVTHSRWSWRVALAVGLTCPSAASAMTAPASEETEPNFVDPRRRQLPRRHRFRLGLAVDYVRLSQAADDNTGESQRFHWAPLQLDFAYQLQFIKYAMIRPSFAFGANVGNSMEAMPALVHPQFHFGYQRPVLGIALGYGWFTPFPQRKDVTSAQRGGLGQPVVTNNHHVGGEVSVTTRVHSGALSFQLRVAGVSSRTRHFDLDNRRWRFMLTFNAGWYFGEGRRAAKRRAQRQRRTEDRELAR